MAVLASARWMEQWMGGNCWKPSSQAKVVDALQWDYKRWSGRPVSSSTFYYSDSSYMHNFLPCYYTHGAKVQEPKWLQADDVYAWKFTIMFDQKENKKNK